MVRQGISLRCLYRNVHGTGLAGRSRGLYNHGLSNLPSFRSTANSPVYDQQISRGLSRLAENIGAYKQAFEFPRPSVPSDLEHVGAKVVVNGFLSRKRVMHSRLVFADLDTGSVRGLTQSVTERVGTQPIQIISGFQDRGSPEEQANKELRAIPANSPVSVTGVVADVAENRIELRLESIKALNSFPKDIIVSQGTVFPPSARHLQIRFTDALRTRLHMRNIAAYTLEQHLGAQGFLQVETPLLFKSTPEGASEFLVPTRQPGMAYALPQSPQQYKQLLMASGVRNYYQFARCFRDEDLRADRQPEFTQLDMELSFATAEDVMSRVEQLIKTVVSRYSQEVNFVVDAETPVPILAKLVSKGSKAVHEVRSWAEVSKASDAFNEQSFPRMSYLEVMTRYGCDKPDLRIPFTLHRLDHILPPDFTQKISKLENPIVEAILYKQDQPSDNAPTLKDIAEFMHSLPPALLNNPHGGPAPVLVDPTKPLNGLSSLGFEAAEKIEEACGMGSLDEGDFFIFQARENKPFEGGSTALGRIRTALYDFALSKGFLPRDHSFRFLWVNEFPMFTPDNDADPGQGGAAGFSATHHPFTAPFSPADFDLLATDPLAARGDSYDLVVNGVELGGGSRRVHLAQMQEDIMRDVLKMSDARIAQFAHLLEALRAGCPPHAGFALGFDRLVAVLSYAESLRDVVAFPKSKKGEDLMVKSPARITDADLERYHLALRGKKQS